MAEPVRILIADDDPVSRMLLKRALGEWDYEVTVTCDGTEAWAALQEPDAPRLAILDWMMPGMDGPQVCRNVRALDREPYTYILLLTSRTDTKDIVAGLGAKADDYLAKPFNPQELSARLRTGRRLLDLQDELIAAREELRELATHDAMTGIWNRYAIMEVLESEIERQKREHGAFVLLLADVDRFKRINDRYGHLVGDEVLREVARRLRNSVRAYDHVGRYGGEEFLLVLPQNNAGNAAREGERILNSVGSTPMDTSEGAVDVTISIGLAIGEGDRNPTTRQLIHAADTALYRAKDNGRNRVEIAQPADYRHLRHHG
jgi:two-component system cell cycle response regulator